MPAAGSPQPNRPKAPKPAATKPLQVMQINRREEQEQLAREAAEARAAAEAAAEKARILEERAGLAMPPKPSQQDGRTSPSTDDDARFDWACNLWYADASEPDTVTLLDAKYNRKMCQPHRRWSTKESRYPLCFPYRETKDGTASCGRAGPVRERAPAPAPAAAAARAAVYVSFMYTPYATQLARPRRPHPPAPPHARFC